MHLQPHVKTQLFDLNHVHDGHYAYVNDGDGDGDGDGQHDRVIAMHKPN